MFSFAKKLVDRFEGSQEPGRDSYFKQTFEINNRGYGLRVLRVAPHSIANEAGLEAWFDYIVRINHHELPMVYPSLSSYSYSINEDGTINYGGNTTQEQAGMVNFELIKQEILTIIERSGIEITFDVWNAKGGVLRQVSIPLRETSAKSDSPTESLLPSQFEDLGLIVQSQHLNTATYVWRILNTHQDSPAFQAQLVPYSDYIIGCDSAFPNDPYGKGLLAQGGESLLSNTVLRYYNHNFEKTHDDCVPITLYVYNHDYDILRPVTVNLTRSWGNGHNKGILGCDVGYGLLHRIPEVIGKFDNEKLTDDVLFESNQDFGYQMDNAGIASTEIGTNNNNSDASNTTTLPPPSGDSFTPMTNNTFTPAPPKPGAASKKKKHASRPNALDGLNDYMNEELQKSKEMESQTVPKPSTDGSVPPPPPKSSK